MKVRAAVARQPHQPFELEWMQLDELRSDEVLVKLVATGICHTDLAVVHQTFPLELPWVLGHEGAGHVVRTGRDVTDLAPGDPVVLTFDSCGHCAGCRDEHPAYCASFAAHNYLGTRPDGSTTIRDVAGRAVRSSFFGQSSFATHAIVRPRNAIKVRADAPLEYLGAFGCGFQTGGGTVLNVLKPEPGAAIGVFGVGAVGFAALFAAKLRGSEKIIAVDRVPARLKLAAELGATHTIDTRHEDLTGRLKELGGLDFAVETSGIPAVAEAAVGALHMRGVCALLGASAVPTFNLPMAFMIPGRVVMGVREGDADPSALVPYLVDRFMEGSFPIDRLSQFYDLEDVNAAVAAAASGDTIKPIVRF